MLEKNASFTDSFDKQCQELSVLQTLLTLVAMIQDCPSIKFQSSFSGAVLSQATLSVANLFQFNISIRRLSRSSRFRHKERETQLVIYVGAPIHDKTNKR